MRAAAIVKGNPVTDDAHRVLEAFEAVAMYALLLQRPDEALDHAVLLRAVRGDELLLQPVAADYGCEVMAGEDQAIVRPQQELVFDTTQGAEPRDQGMLKGGAGRCRLARFRKVPAQQLAGVAVDHQGQ